MYAAALTLGLPAPPSAALALAAGVAATGALHEDGLSDTADGLFGGRTRERRLEIMRDSRIGSYGAAALGLSLLLRFSALSAILAPGEAFLALFAAHAASRALLAPLLASTPPARGDGLSASAGIPPVRSAAVALALGALALAPLGLHGFLAAGLLALLFIGVRTFAKRRIGGQTGDIAGALQQGAEITILLVAAARFAGDA